MDIMLANMHIYENIGMFLSFVPVRLLLSLLLLNHYHVVAAVAMFVVTEVYYASIIQHNLDHTLCVLFCLMFFGKAQQHETLIFLFIRQTLIP